MASHTHHTPPSSKPSGQVPGLLVKTQVKAGGVIMDQ